MFKYIKSSMKSVYNRCPENIKLDIAEDVSGEMYAEVEDDVKDAIKAICDAIPPSVNVRIRVFLPTYGDRTRADVRISIPYDWNGYDRSRGKIYADPTVYIDNQTSGKLTDECRRMYKEFIKNSGQSARPDAMFDSLSENIKHALYELPSFSGHHNYFADLDYHGQLDEIVDPGYFEDYMYREFISNPKSKYFQHSDFPNEYLDIRPYVTRIVDWLSVESITGREFRRLYGKAKRYMFKG